jgi:Ca-activated chloride channel family protein
MSFLAGSRLLLLLFVLGLALAYVFVQRQRRQYAVRFTNVDLLASVAPTRPGWRRHLAAACLLLALVLIVMAFARPARAVQVPRETATVMLAVDVSQSMRATDVEPTRIKAAQRAVRAFVDSLPRRFRLGLVAFAGNAQVLVPPTHQRDLVRGAVANLQLQQQTAIGEAMFASIGAIENSPLDKGKRPPARIVLLSDGATNAGRPNAEAIAAAKKKGVRVSTIAFGTDSGTVVVQDEVVPVPADREALRKIADDTGGRFASAATEKDLRKTYEDLGSRLAEVTRRREVTPWFIGAALLFAFAAAGTSLVWTSRLP